MNTIKKIIKGSIEKLLDIFGLTLVRKKSLVDFYLHEYSSYDEYKSIQIFHNRRKISNIWADSRTLDRVAELVLNQSHGAQVQGLCHGTRNGFEQAYLNSRIVGAHILGTEISETGLNFPNTVQWDFHDARADWIERFDFIYTNSLDQSWKPKKAIQVWLNQLKKDGLLIIEHTLSHGPNAAGYMDPFGVRPVVLPYVLTTWFGDKITIKHSVQKKSNMELDAYLFCIKKVHSTTLCES